MSQTAPTLPDTTDPAHYALGRSPDEARRLMLQHRIYESATRQLFEAAGISAGMRVLDVGSGAGDVALLVADLVGPTGEVVGVEIAPESIALATERASDAGVASSVRFVARRPARPRRSTRAPFDAVVGRWVLMYQPDPVALLRRLAGMLRPGGVVAFQESDLLAMHRPYPPAPLHEQLHAWMQPPHRHAVSSSAWVRSCSRRSSPPGCPAPTVRIDTPVGGGPDWVGYEYVAATTRSLLPMLSTLGDRRRAARSTSTRSPTGLRDEIVDSHGVQPLASVYGAWARVP